MIFPFIFSVPKNRKEHVSERIKLYLNWVSFSVWLDTCMRSLVRVRSALSMKSSDISWAITHFFKKDIEEYRLRQLWRHGRLVYKICAYSIIFCVSIVTTFK